MRDTLAEFEMLEVKLSDLKTPEARERYEKALERHEAVLVEAQKRLAQQKKGK